ncbi:MAG: hypothetical protein AAF357_01245 [Verrucomicrobiota bacterium]
MKRARAALVSLITFSCLFAEDEWIDDAGIRNQFLEQIVALKESKQSSGLSAADLRSALRKEKRINLDLKTPEPHLTKLSIRELYEHGKRRTLVVGHIFLRESSDEWRTNLAGGVVISENGVAVTNYHVLQFEQAAIFAAMNHLGELFTIEEVLASSRHDDLAVGERSTFLEFSS